MQAVTPQVVFYLFGLPFLPITNTVVSTWVLMVVIISLAIIIRKIKPIAGEMLVEFVNNVVSSVMPEETNVTKFLILLGPLAVFLLMANNFSIFPRMVSPTADINTTVALSIIIFFATHIFGIREKGVINYFKDMMNPIFIFPLEVVSQFSRTLSLSIRLFGNILSTDLIVAIIFSLIPFLVPLPLAALGVLTGVLQAYIFLVLASLYIASSIEIKEIEEERRKLKQEASKLS